ncbi:MAG: GyrI-like domain-containing protein, partial [Bacillota bacterium]
CECRTPAYCFNVYHDCEYKTKDIDVEICESVTQKKDNTPILKFITLPAVKTAATIEHKGSYDTLCESYNRIFKWVKDNNYKIAGNPRESFIDGIWNKENPDEWLTEIQIPIL